MTPVSVEAPCGRAFSQQTLHLGIVLPERSPENVDDPSVTVPFEAAIEELAGSLRQLHVAQQRGRAELFGGELEFRCVALEPGQDAAELAAVAKAHGLSFMALRLETRERPSDAGASRDALVIESTPEHEAEDGLALQTVFLDQIDVLIDLRETGHSFATAALLRTARLAAVPIVTAAQIVETRGKSPAADLVPIRTGLLEALCFGGNDDTSQLREANAFCRLTHDAGQARRPELSGQGLIEALEARLATTLAHADQVASRYGSRSRTVAMLRILFGAVATLGVFFAFYFADVVRNFRGEPAGARSGQFHGLETAGYGLDVLAIVAVLVLAGLAKRQPWSRRFAAARYVAEHVRHMPAMAALGNTVTRLRPPLPGAPAPKDWPTWYLRRIAREIGCPVGRVTAEDRRTTRRIFDDLVAGQIRFYEKRARRFARLARGLSWLANGCYVLGLAAVLLRLAVFVQVDPDAKFRLAVSLGTFLFPALGSVFVGLRAQGEYAKLGKRYDLMARTLRVALQAGVPERSFASLMDHVRGTVTTMLEEVADWHVLFKSHTISPL